MTLRPALKGSDSVVPTAKKWLKIGDYYIARYQHGGFWIEHESGEGMQVKEEQLAKVIADFYSENF